MAACGKDANGEERPKAAAAQTARRRPAMSTRQNALKSARRKTWLVRLAFTGEPSLANNVDAAGQSANDESGTKQEVYLETASDFSISDRERADRAPAIYRMIMQWR
jgi:hypothetical protein